MNMKASPISDALHQRLLHPPHIEVLSLARQSIVNRQCPETPGTVRRIHRLWEGPQGAAYRVNWHEDEAVGPWGSEHRVVASCFVTVSASGQVACQ